MSLITKILSIGSDKKLKQYRALVDQINSLEPEMQKRSDDELKAQTYIFKAELANGATLADILPRAYATVRETSVRTLGMRHYDEQLIAALALNDNMIAEAATGSGKTLSCTPAVYLNALTGKGVHVVTVNDYLAERDCTQMSNIYRFLGLRTGCILAGKTDGPERQSIYLGDVIYGTNSEFGFDYLRDNMITDPTHRVQRNHHYAIVDEVDSILIDEARTPLIISGKSDNANDIYIKFAKAVRGLTVDEDFEMDESKKQIGATESGLEKIERATGIDIYADTSGAMVNHLQNALRAEYLFHRDKEYLVHDGEVLIVDEFTGRVLPGRRYSDGLHQAIEAKENVEIKSENETLATITLQNYFRMYEKLAGMTGTAMTEDAEFRSTYNLPVMAIPDHKPNIRVDHDDLVFATLDAKFNAIADEVKRRHETGQPCLIGTVSIENSERLSRILQKRGLPHNVLNAKQHAREAEIVAQAGRYGAITIATNMAGRGTDIMLGGNAELIAKQNLIESGYNDENPAPEGLYEAVLERAQATCKEEQEKVIATGGLCIIGSERHESRRIDNQLRGRAARQGDPGETQFWLSLDDDLIRLFAADKVENVRRNMRLAEMDESEPLRSRMLTRVIEGAQHRIEEINFGIRKNTLEYDDVMNKQRETIYAERNLILDGEDILADSDEIIQQISDHTTSKWAPDSMNPMERDITAVTTWAHQMTGQPLEYTDPEWSSDELADAVFEHIKKYFDKKISIMGTEKAKIITKQIMLKIIDTRWRTYLQEMDYLKTGIGLRGFGQRDPLIEYKREAYNGFESLVTTIYEDYVRIICHLEIADERRERLRAAMRAANEANKENVA